MIRKIIITILIFTGAFTIYAQTKVVKTDLIYKVNEPKKSTKKPRIIVLLHGYGSNEEDLFDISKSFDEQYLTFSLRAPYPAQGQGYSWFSLEFLPGRKFNYDYKQAVASRNKVLSFISNACRAYNADSSNIFLLGYSQGAIMCYDIALSNPEKIKGVIALSGLMMPETKKLKSNPSKLAAVKFFVAHGTTDNVVAYNDGEEAAKFLQSKKSKVTFKSYEMPHAINGKELNDIKNWLRSGIPAEK